MTFTPATDEPPARGKATRRRQPSKPPSTRSLRKEIDAFIVFMNGIIAVIAPHDALDATEQATLVHAIDEECKINARFRRGVESLLNVTSGGSLWMVIAIISARRVARHGVLGSQFGPVVDDGGHFILSTINAEPSEAAQSMEAIIGMFTKPADAHDTTTPDSAAGNGTSA